ncbi:MMPL family transporter [Pseudosporangium ferrugineum]|uniref:RND superfamily putative drug exporter n=1 Tax=Pseudosporangium ferrugineum TaxID=439699 RepID=A0A2T0RG49_9ACTN|nr:MMPL family transporter [Pseudosporangium ferrugineum]PRY20143.1 RND superfamily putative drug exporter [Pseudosporangium ferrugineum]
MTRRQQPDPPAHPRLGYAGRLVRARWVVVAVWVLLALTANGVPSGGGGVDGFVSPDSPPIQTELQSFQKFGFPLLSRVAVVQRDPDGLSNLTQAEAVARAAAVTQRQYDDVGPILGAIPVPNTFGWFPGSRENGTTIITLLFIPPDVGFSAQAGAAHDFVNRHFGPEDRVVGVTGTVPARVEQGTVVGRSLPTVEMATLAAVLLIVAVAFRSLVAPLITLFTAGVAIRVTLQVAAMAGAALKVDIPSEVEPLLVALLLGVVTDYVVFYLFAMRAELGRGLDRLEAARRATRRTTPIVAVAGMTVACGTGVLVVAESALFRAFGPGMALAVLVGVAVATTLAPALLAILGPVALWPGGRRNAGEAARRGLERRHRRMRRLVRPGTALTVLLTGLAALTLAAVPVRHMDIGLSFVPSLPAGNEVRQAASAARAGFADGIVSPTVLLVQGKDVVKRRDALAALQTMIAGRSGVAGVVGPADQFAPQAAGLVLSRDGDAARYLIVLDSAPLGATAIDTLSALRTDLPTMVHSAGLDGVTVGIAGDTAIGEMVVRQTLDDLERIVVATLLVNLLMVMLFLRALLAPVLLLGLNVLALGSTLGITTWLFDTVLGHDGLTFYVPFAAAVLLVALGSDYTIFTVGHVWQEARRRPLREALVAVVPPSSRTVTTAAITLAASFALLAVVPLRPFREIAFAMSLGVLLDAVLVRSLLVPALLALLGRASGWPNRLQ